jgi:hypothetical protein
MDNSLSATKGNLEQGLKRSISITFVHEIVAGNKTEVCILSYLSRVNLFLRPYYVFRIMVVACTFSSW